MIVWMKRVSGESGGGRGFVCPCHPPSPTRFDTASTHRLYAVHALRRSRPPAVLKILERSNLDPPKRTEENSHSDTNFAPMLDEDLCSISIDEEQTPSALDGRKQRLRAAFLESKRSYPNERIFTERKVCQFESCSCCVLWVFSSCETIVV